MSVYTVHAPPPKADEVTPEPERFVFVRDGFHVWAFLLGPFWMIRHRLWLVLLAYIFVLMVLVGGLVLVRASETVTVIVMTLLALLLGFEAATLRRFTLARRRWENLGLVVGDDRDAAERRFYDAWIVREAPVAPSASPSVWRPQPATEVIGLFPEPGASR